ncbi:MAG: Ig-like domain-containing protein [Coriobacteriaceae bacterium]|nr:Ig-like domain-containing protein [Coriobacteriaceae bacterium]
MAVSALLALAMFPIVAVADDEASEASEAPIQTQENLETQPVDDAPGNQTVDTGDSTAAEQPEGSSSVSDEAPETEDAPESGNPAEGESVAGEDEQPEAAKSQTVSFRFQHASVTIGSQDGLTLDGPAAFEAAVDRDLRFDAIADDGFVIGEVTASNANGAVAPVRDGDTYVIAADAVKAGGLAVDIAAVEADTEASDEDGYEEGDASDQKADGADASDPEEADDPAVSDEADDSEDPDLESFGAFSAFDRESLVLEVGESKEIHGKGNTDHRWRVSGEEGIISLSDTSDDTVTVTALKSGTVTVVHDYSYVGWMTHTERFSVSVTDTEPTAAIDILEESATVFFNPKGTNPSNDNLAVTLHATTDPDDADVTWTSSNPSIATVDQNGRVTATGRGEGTVTITASSGDLLDTCEVVVKSTKGQTPVYIYLNVSNLEDYNFPGIEPNGSGWYTIGYYMLDERPTASSGAMDATISSWVANCIRYSGNTGIPTDFLVSIVESYDLKLVGMGADDYVSAGNAWHLDLYASSASKTYPVTVNYIDEGTGEILDTATGKYAIGSEVSASWYKKAISGYTFDYADPQSITVSNSDKDVLNLYYKKNRTITVSLADKTVEYDGQSHSLDDPRISGGPSGLSIDDLDVVVEGCTGTEAGDYSATISGNEIYTSNGVVYDVVYRGASLHIVKNTKLTEIIADSDSKVYDGQALTDSGFSVVYDGATIHSDASGIVTLPTGDTVTAVVEGSQTDAGESANTVKSFTVSGDFDTENIKKTNGILSVSKRPVTFTGESGVRTFTGTEIELTGVSVSTGTDQGLVEGHSSNVTASAKGTEAGNYGGEITPKADVRIKSGLKDVTANYDITVIPGALTIVASAAEWSITLEDDTYTYDGQSHANAKTPVSNALSGTTQFSYSFSADSGYVSDLGSLTKVDAGTYTIFVKAMNPNYQDPAFTQAKLVINPRAVTLASASLEKKYDGNPLTNANAKDSGVTGGETVNENGLLIEDGWVAGEGASYVFTGSQLIQGSTANSFTYTLKDGTKASNYLVSKSEGTLNVVSAQGEYEITVEAKSDSVKYDGQAHSVSGFKTLEFTVNGKTYTVEGLTAQADGTDAGVYASNVVGTPVVRDASGNDVTENFTVHIANGALTIGKRSVTLTSATDSKQFDGKPLMNSGVTVGGDGWAAGEGASYSVTGFQKYSGSSKNVFSYTLDSGTEAQNYDITVIEGTLTVFDRTVKYAIELEANSYSGVYDGQSHSAEGVKTDRFVFDGVEYTVSGFETSDPVSTDVAESANIITAPTGFVVTDTDGVDVSSQFAVSTKNGSFSITPKPVTLSSQSKSWEYDGEEHSAPFVSGTDAFYKRDDISASAPVVVKDVTESVCNEIVVSGASGKPGLGNYEITKEEGTLSVAAKDGVKVTIVENSGTVTYDGAEHEVTGYSIASIEIDGKASSLYGATDFAFTGEQSDATARGIDAGTYEMNLTDEMFENLNGNFKGVEFVVEDGSLIIEKRPAIVSGDGWDAEQPYTGEEYFTDECSFQNIVEGQIATISYELKGKAPGSYEGRFGKEGELDFRVEDPEGKDVTENYVLEARPGSLTIVKGQIAYVTLSTADVVKEYDGKTYEAGVASAIDKNGHEVKVEYSVDGKYWIDDPSRITATDVADSVEIQVRASVESVYEGYIYGTQKLMIEPRKVVVTGDGWTEEQPYTGKEYSKDTCSFENIVEGQTATISYSLKGIQPGSYTGEFGDDFKVVAEGKDVSSNYELIDKIPGKLSIAQPEQAVPEGSDTPSEGKKPVAEKAVELASKVAKTGDGIMLYALGICGIAVAAGIVALAARRKSGGKQ